MSEFGYKSSVLKSGICKYFRRGEKIYLVCNGMANFDICEKQNGAKVMNLINRLKILLMKN